MVSANQHLTVFVSVDNLAKGTSLAATAGESLATALVTPATLTYQSSNGLCYATVELAKAGAIDITPGNNTGDGTYAIVYKDASGVIFRRAIEGATKEAVSKPYVAQVQKVSTITIPTAPTAGQEYVVRVGLPNYAEAISQTDEYSIRAGHVVQVGDDEDTVAAGIAAAFQKVLAKAPVPYLTVGVSLNVLTFTALKQPYVKSKFEGKPVSFAASLEYPSEVAAGETVTTIPKMGSGVDNQVLALEEFFSGYNTGNENRGADFPIGTEPILSALAGKTYDTTSWVLKKQFGDATIGTQRQEILCFFQKV